MGPSVTILFRPRHGVDAGGAIQALMDAISDEHRVDVVEVRGVSGTAALNDAASRAVGEFLCVMSGSEMFPARWLPKLLQPFDLLPSVGATGAMIVNERNRVVEAGRVVLKSGDYRLLNHGLSPADRRCQFVNDVDGLSTSCLVIRRDTFLRIGGFSGDYLTAAYRDLDFGMKLARLQLRALVCPTVLAANDEHASLIASPSQIDLDSDRMKFVERFSEALAEREAFPSNGDALRVCRRRGTIAWYFIRTPTWDRDSGALRLRLLLLGLARSGYHVVMVLPVESNPYLADLEAHGIETVQADAGDHPAVLAMLRAYRPEAAVFSHAYTEGRFAAGCQACSPETVRILDTVDLHFLRETRQRAVRLGFGGAPAFTPETLSPAAIAELSSGIRSDATLVVSSAERDLLIDQLQFDPDTVRVVSNVHVPEPEQRSWTERTGFLFLGGYGHSPNVDSVLWIAAEIWPLIRLRLPGATLRLVGSAAPPEIRDLHDRTAGIEVVGFVADHRAMLGTARVMLAPLAYGAGVKGKVGEALAVGTVVVTNHIGAEGMDPAGRALALGGSAADLADLAVSIHEDQAEWNRRSSAGLQILCEGYSQEHHVGELIEAILQSREKRHQQSFWNLVSEYLWHERSATSATSTLDTSLRQLRWQGRAQRRQLKTLRARVRALMTRAARLEPAMSASAVRRRSSTDRRAT